MTIGDRRDEGRPPVAHTREVGARAWIPPMEFDPAKVVAMTDSETAALAEDIPPPPRPSRRRAALALVLALAGLVGAGLAFDAADLMTRAAAVSPWLGGAVGGLVAVALGALVWLTGREVGALARLRRVETLRERAAILRQAGGHGRAADLRDAVSGLYAGRRELAPHRAALDRQVGDAHDDREVLDLTERLLLDPVDRMAYRLVLKASRDVAVGTALSPAAVIDVALVLWRNVRLVREIAGLYAARPGLVGSALLLRRMLENLTAAGVMDAGDGLVTDALGGSLAAALSTRLGHGIANGLLTARIGLAAMHLCRPLPFAPERRPRLTEIRKALVSLPRDAF